MNALLNNYRKHGSETLVTILADYQYKFKAPVINPTYTIEQRIAAIKEILAERRI